MSADLAAEAARLLGGDALAGGDFETMDRACRDAALGVEPRLVDLRTGETIPRTAVAIAQRDELRRANATASARIAELEARLADLQRR